MRNDQFDWTDVLGAMTRDYLHCNDIAHGWGYPEDATHECNRSWRNDALCEIDVGNVMMSSL
jgi:hypothetical protein